jgi:hypothetical protein
MTPDRERQLLEANNKEVERRRSAEALAQDCSEAMRVFVEAYTSTLRRLREAVKPFGGDPLDDVVDLACRHLERLRNMEK